MRRGELALLAPFMFGAALAAQTPVTGIRADQIALSSTKPEAAVARVSPDEVVSRMLTFDANRDGKVARTELTDRMQPMLVRADKNRDGALDAKEIRAFAQERPPSRTPQEGPLVSSYGFADEDVSFSSRNHVTGAIDDLKLAAGVKDEALSLAMTFVDGVEADAEANLGRELFGVLPPDQISDLQASLRGRQRAVSNHQSQDGVNRQFVAAAGVSPINQFRLTPDKRLLVQKAVDRYSARRRMSQDDRVALVDRMSGILNVEERNNLGAALARRPLVEMGTVGALPGGSKEMLGNAFRGTARTQPALPAPTSVRLPQGR